MSVITNCDNDKCKLGHFLVTIMFSKPHPIATYAYSEHYTNLGYTAILYVVIKYYVHTKP